MSTQWETMLQKIEQEYENNPVNFLRMPMISRTIHPNMQRLAIKYYNELLQDEFITQQILPTLSTEHIGNPYKFNHLPKCSPTTIFQLLHLKLIRERLGVFIPQSDITNIVEIGGGYGNLARIMYDLEYEGSYSIIDFPLMSRIQDDFLTKCGISDVNTVELNDNTLTPTGGKSMLIGTYSISEMPISTRQYIESFYDNFDYIFIAHNASFDGDDNVKYFNDLQERLDSTFNIDYFKNNHNQHWFMICKRIENTK